jgi:ABC-type nickel/cobalt efflux system permease component RcnA
MSWMQILGQLFLTGCGAWFVWAASRHAEDAERSAEGVRHARAKIIALDAALESLEAQHKKLNGRFYALRQELDIEGADTENAVMHRAAHNAGPVLPLDSLIVCEQWQLAQQDGPSSPAAQCQCAYCMRRRAERERARNELVPKTVRGQAEMAKLNAGKP